MTMSSTSDTCTTVSHNKSTGHGTFDMNAAIPLDKFTSIELIELNGNQHGNTYKFKELLHDNGSIVLVVRRPGM